jgi:hypothetical protein
MQNENEKKWLLEMPRNKAAFGKLGATTFSTMKELVNLLKFD